MSTRQPTVAHAFAALVDARPNQPLITYYDDATGERAELSGATLANWVAKTANLLVDGLGLGPGQVAVVRLPPHWQTAAVLVGCWFAGLTVDLTGSAHADVAFIGPTVTERPPADEVYALALAPLGQPFRPGPPPGTADYVVEVRPHADRLPPLATTPEQVALTGGTRHAELAALARHHDVPESARVLIDADAHPDPMMWLIAPLLANTSVVLCRNVDPAGLPGRLSTEHAVLFPPT